MSKAVARTLLDAAHMVRCLPLAYCLLTSALLSNCSTEEPEIDAIDDTFLSADKADAFGVASRSYDAAAIVDFASTAALADLRTAGLDLRAARAVTAAARPFASLEALDAVPYSGKIFFSKLRDHVRAQGLVGRCGDHHWQVLAAEQCDGTPACDAACNQVTTSLQTTTRADAIDRNGTPFLRVEVRLDGLNVLASNANDLRNWQLKLDGNRVATEAAQLYVAPSPTDRNRAGAAVLLIPGRYVSGSTVDVALNQQFATRLTVATTRELGRVVVQPIVVRPAPNGGPARTDADISAQMQGFAALYNDRCNIDLKVLPSRSLQQPGFERLVDSDFIAIDDPAGVANLRKASGETVALLVGRRMFNLLDAADRLLGQDRTVVRAFVFAMHQSEEQANAISALVFHLDDVATFFGVPHFYFGSAPKLPMASFDEAQPQQTPMLLTPLQSQQVRALYFGDDHVEAFGHELGHALALPHPGDSSFIDASSDRADQENLMDGAAECLPNCAVTITQHQCEIMLLGLTGGLTRT